MSVEKLSVSMESSLAKLIRNAASEEGVSLSTWLSEAARARARHRALRTALQDQSERHGKLTAEDVANLIEAARRNSVVSRSKRKRR